MSVLAWLLVISLFLLVAVIVVNAVAVKRGVSARWSRGSILTAGAFFATIAALLLWQTRSEALELARVPNAETQASLAPPPDPFASQGPPLAARGRKLYLESGCDHCHLIGGGALLGPDLIDAGAKYDETFLIKWIMNPHGTYSELGVATVNPDFPPMPSPQIAAEDAVLIAHYLRSFGERK